MDQEKFGKFLSKLRKEKNLTQRELAEILGVNDRTISRWENANYMPDISMLKVIADNLDVSIIELLNGEKIEEKVNKKDSDKFLVKSLDIIKNKNYKDNKKIGTILIILGVLLIFFGLIILKSTGSWRSIYSIIGLIFCAFGISNMQKEKKKKILIFVLTILLGYTCFSAYDFISIKYLGREPIYAYSITTKGESQTYDMLLYKVHYCKNSYETNMYILGRTSKFTCPENNLNSINHLLKYKNKYYGNASNTTALFRNLSLGEYITKGFEISDSVVHVKYYHTEKYINEDHEKDNYTNYSLVYNSLLAYLLIDNLDKISYEFYNYNDELVSSYEVNRKDFVNNYPNFDSFKDGDNIDTSAVETEIKKLEDANYIETIFNTAFKNL